MSAAAYTPITLPVIPADPQLEKKVAQKVATMSLDEKIGQMIQLQIDIIGDHDADGVFHFSQAKADSVIGTYKVGSFLNTPRHHLPHRRRMVSVDTQDTGNIAASHGHTHHLRPRPEPRHHLHSRRHTLPAKPQRSGDIRHLAGSHGSRNHSLRDTSLRLPLDILAHTRSRPRPALAAFLGKLWRRPAGQRTHGSGRCQRLPGRRPQPRRGLAT